MVNTARLMQQNRILENCAGAHPLQLNFQAKQCYKNDLVRQDEKGQGEPCISTAKP